MTRALDTLIRAVAARDPARARQAALQGEQAALDLQFRHRPPAQVDPDRMGLWARQVLVDVAAKDRGAVAGDAATLRILWDRAGHHPHHRSHRRRAGQRRAAVPWRGGEQG